MKIRKTLTAMAAALLMITVSAPASAFECEGNGNLYDPATIQANLTALAVELRCETKDPEALNPGKWVMDAIWEKRRAPSCETHQKLARNLHEARKFALGTKPRKNKNNDAAGAAWDVRNGSYEEAIAKLDLFIKAVMNSTLNREFKPSVSDAQMLANELVTEAEEARVCIDKLLP